MRSRWTLRSPAAGPLSEGESEMSIMVCGDCGAVYGPTVLRCPVCRSGNVSRGEIQPSPPAPDAGREPSKEAVEAAWNVCYPSDVGNAESCKEAIAGMLAAAYQVDFPASQPGKLTDAAQRERLATLIDSFFRESWLYEVPSDAVQRLADRLLATGLFATGASFSSADNRALLAEVNSYVIHGKDCAWHWPKPPAFERPACNCIKARIARALSPAPKGETPETKT